MHRTLTVSRCSRIATSTFRPTSTKRPFSQDISKALYTEGHIQPCVKGHQDGFQNQTLPIHSHGLSLSTRSTLSGLTTTHHHMSNLPTKPIVSFPTRPESSKATATVSTSETPTALTATPSLNAPSLLTRISHSLPPRPSFVSNETRPRSPIQRSEDRHHDGQYQVRGSDFYRPRSLTPDRRFDTYRSLTPPRSDWDRTDSYIPRPPSPLPRRRTFERSLSPVKLQQSPVKELPKTFFTHAHKKAESAAAKATALREEAEAVWKAKEEAQNARTAVREQEARESSLSVLQFVWSVD